MKKWFYVLLAILLFISSFFLVFSIGWPVWIVIEDIFSTRYMGLLGYKLCNRHGDCSYILYGTRSDVVPNSDDYKTPGAIACSFFILSALGWLVAMAFMLFKSKKSLVSHLMSRFVSKAYYTMYFLPIFGSILASVGWGVWYAMVPKTGRIAYTFYFAMCAWILPFLCFVMLIVRKSCMTRQVKFY